MDLSQLSGDTVLIGDIQKYVDVLTRHFDFKYTPLGTKEAYEAALKADKTSTERIFLEGGGFHAWFSYFLTQRAMRMGHFPGKSINIKVFCSVEEIPPEGRQLIARAVVKAIPPEAHLRIETVFRRITSTNQYQFTTWLKKSQQQLDQHRRATTSGELSNGQDTTINNEANYGQSATSNDEASNSQMAMSNNSKPSVHRVTALFPLFLAEAVRKFPPANTSDGWTSAIAMNFTNSDACAVGDRSTSYGMMSMEIASHKVQRLASWLFDVDVESYGDSRCILLSTGATIHPNPNILLKGCKPEVIEDVFGPCVLRAIQACPTFKVEADRGTPLTNCITMTISSGVNDSAFIHLYLDGEESLLLKKMLFE